MTTNDELRAMRERVEAATEGPWEADGDDFRQVQRDGDGEWIASVRTHRRGTAKADATFIAHARTDLPKLLDALDRVIPIHFSRNGYCNECGGQHPCATVRAITEALDSQ